jgi:uncharacterized protein YbjT (DUF2867 family)
MKIAVAGGTGTVGQYVVEAGRAAGHNMVILSRAEGFDLRDPASEAGLGLALSGADVIIDTTDPHTLARRAATAFFEEIAERLQRIGSQHDVSRVVTLSIVGVDRVAGFGYYEAKQRHEAVTLAGPLPATIVRATQFHEFPAQLLRSTRHGPLSFMMVMRTQPIAARTVGHYLFDIATRDVPDAQVVQIAGPEPTSLVTLARQYLHRRGRRSFVIPFPLPGSAGRAMRRGAVLPSEDVPRLGPIFTDWLQSPDAIAIDP